MAEGTTGGLLEGRYRIERALGEGGMGSVHLARDLKMGRQVAIKFPHPEFLRQEGFRERFAREIRSLIRIDHPHVVKILDVGEQDGVPYAVLQHLGGGSLATALSGSRRRRSAGEVARWLAPVADALDFIHGHGYVHRDVKPANILFDEAGHVYLADFGIAKAVAAGATKVESLTQTGAWLGSPAYMAPEAMDGIATPACDQYSLGAVVYQILSGALPHEAATPNALLVRKATVPARPLDELVPELAGAVADAAMKALAAVPGERYPNCTAFAAAFQAGVVGGGVERATAIRTVGARRLRPRRALVVVAVGLVLAAAAGGAAAIWHGRQRVDDPPPSETPKGGGLRPHPWEAFSTLPLLPVLYIDEIRATPGVQSATHCTWFGGRDPEHEQEEFATIAVDSTYFLEIYRDEFQLSDGSAVEWADDFQGGLVGESLARKLGWKVGSLVTLTTPILRGGVEFRVSGVYASEGAMDGATFWLHWKYLNSLVLADSERHQIGWVVSRIDDSARSADIAAAIDARFEESEVPTRTTIDPGVTTGLRLVTVARGRAR